MASSAGVPCDLDSSAAVGTIALVDSSKRVVFDGGSQFLVDDSSSTASAIAIRPHARVAAQTFLTACEERSKKEEAAIAAARTGRISPRSSRKMATCLFPTPAGRFSSRLAGHDLDLVTEIEVSDQDLRQLKKWTHNQDAVLWFNTFLCPKVARPRLRGALRRGRKSQRSDRSRRGSDAQRSCAGT